MSRRMSINDIPKFGLLIMMELSIMLDEQDSNVMFHKHVFLWRRGQ